MFLTQSLNNILVLSVSYQTQPSKISSIKSVNSDDKSEDKIHYSQYRI